MKQPFRSSFRRKLTAAFLAVGVVPLLICVVLMLNVFQLFLARSTEDAAATQLAAVTEDMGGLLSSCEDVMRQLGRHDRILRALNGAGQNSQTVYSALYAAASPLLREADFSLYDARGCLLYTTATASAKADLSTTWGLLAAAGGTSGVVYRNVSSGGTAAGCMQAARAVRSGGHLAGYVVVSLNSGHFRRLLEGKYGAGSDVIILDAFWDEVYATPTLQNEALAATLRQRLLAGQELAGDGENVLYHVVREEVSGFYVVLRQPKPVADWVMRLLYLITTLSILLCLGLCLAVSMAFSRQVFRPIRSLNSAMAAVEGGDLDVRVEVTGTDELSQLAGRFNRMTERLKTNLTDSIRQQQELGDAQIRMMQAQLNPHFLYNTLDTLKWMGKIHRIPEVATISADLADILRRSISAGEFVRLEDELHLLERYVEIQKIRFAGKFEFRTEVDDSLLDVLLPKLMLQPLVENAIIHGFEDGVPGEITVSAACAGDELFLTVEDNGCGMPPESLRRFREQTAPTDRHLGLYNVDAILRLHYGADHGLKFLPPSGGRGTRIRIAIPITRQGGTAS
ncbi:MAG: sensor histidine kinase [Oscillospiraceae bacterium]|nr:sensor histidine kinase [Oscillospiraceae bacterium]